MRTKGGRERGSALKARQAEYDEEFETWERATGLPGGYTRPGSQQRDRGRP